MDRRSFLQLSGAGALSGFLPSSGLAADNASFKLDGLHKQIAIRAKELADNRGVSIKILYPIGSIANIQTVGENFERSTGVKVTFQEAPLDDINSQILLSNLTGEANFDIALPATFGIPDLAQAGAIKNLSQFARQYEPAGFQQKSLYSIGDYYKGELYGYQTDGDAYVMFYNRRFLEDEEAGKRFSDKYGRLLGIPETWSELKELASFFHQPEEGVFGGSLFRTAGYLPWEWWIRFHSKGYFPLNDEMEPQINNEAGIEALEELIELSAFLDPRTKTDGLFENWASFAEGNSVCNIGWGGSQKFFNSEKSGVRGKLHFSSTPGGIVDGKLLHTPYFNWGWNYVVSANSAEAEIAYLFTLFACSPNMSTQAVSFSEGYFDPFRDVHYDNPAIIKTYSKKFLETHRYSMANAIPDLYLDGQGQYFGALRENLAAAVSGNLTPKQALDRTASEWRLITFRIGKKSQLEQWRFLKSRYPNDLPQRLK